MPTKDWIGKAKIKPGALHKQLGYPVGNPIPTPVLQKIQHARLGTQVHGHPVDARMKHRAQFALNMRKK
jgi:hypothetical protein